MVAPISLVDQSPLGEEIRRFTMVLASETLTVRELIEARVRDEVERQREHADQPYQGLVPPTDAERTLNGSRLRKGRRINADAQVAKAIQGFEGNAFFLLVDDRQIEDLDEVLVLRPDSHVAFVRLVQLVGG